MNYQFNDLTRDLHVQEALKSARSQAEAAQVLRAFAAEKGCRLTDEEIQNSMSGIVDRELEELREEELLEVSGGLRCNTSYTNVQVTKCSEKSCYGW